MKKLLKTLGILLVIVILALSGLFIYLNRGLSTEPQPASFNCLNIEDGFFVDFDTIPESIFGVGLAYAGHINETASEFDPKDDPPIFRKSVTSRVVNGASVKIPDYQEIIKTLEELEPGISEKLGMQVDIPALLDYETELGFVLLEDINFSQLENAEYAPRIGFFMANDFGARSLAILGEGQVNRYEYWGISKSFPGFTPMSDKVWIPHEFKTNALPCIIIETLVNGEIRQHQSTSDLIYTPLEMLQFIHRKYPNTLLKKGDLVLTGTPGGVIFSSPRWLVRAANMIGMDRFKKLELSTEEGDLEKFLKAGDEVVVRGEGLGSVEVLIVE